MKLIEDKVKQIITETLGVDLCKVVQGASFIADLGADSLDCLEVMMSIEEEFGIDMIDDETAKKLTTVKDAIDYVKKEKGVA